jgi:acyl-CoA reductase-like NAD-dependent aldehyde dehydrogenase
MEMNWSRWFHCESSFGLLLVPSQPGVFALAEEVVQSVGPQSRRMLAVFEVAEAEDLSRAMSRLFAAGSPWREKMAQVRVYVRYAIAPSIADRRAAATALKNWLSTQREVASHIFEQKPAAAEQMPIATAEKPAMAIAAVIGSDQESTASGLKTVAERAVDRVTHGIKLGKAIPAGF